MTGERVKQTLLMRFGPPVAALTLAAVFVLLGLWQLDRAGQKKANTALFATDNAYAAVGPGQPVQPFQRLLSHGRYLPERQFLIDKMIVEGRVGYFVITPFEYDRDSPLLLVNRGWLRKTALPELPDIGVSAESVTVLGVAGNLPKVGIRSEAALSGTDGWPKIAVYPTLAEVAGELGREVLPYVLLLNPQPDSAFIRRWQPDESGPMMHYGYAVQWFAMAIAMLIVLVWQQRKKTPQGPA